MRTKIQNKEVVKDPMKVLSLVFKEFNQLLLMKCCFNSSAIDKSEEWVWFDRLQIWFVMFLISDKSVEVSTLWVHSTECAVCWGHVLHIL